jgi:predicted MFS family arabinose efflux permease
MPARIKKVLIEAYSGLAKEVWILSAVMLINRVGSMVVPFLSVYLAASLGYSYSQVGWILSIYGIGSIVGTFIGGWLTDRWGHYRLQSISLLLSGVFLLILSQLKDFLPLLVGVGLFSIISETLRPANASAIAFYAKPDTLTRSFSLNRMSVNLGFSMGPAAGGFLASISYQWLFLVDAITCIVAGLLFIWALRPAKGTDGKRLKHEIAAKAPNSKAYKDLRFLFFVAMVVLFAISFMQLLVTLPLYYKQEYQLSEFHIGLLLALNGAIVFFAEMLLVYLLGEKVKPSRLILLGTLLNGLSFLMLGLWQGIPLLVMSMVVLSIAEILAMPYMASLTVKRAGAGSTGSYLGWYAAAYSIGHVLAPLLGTNMVKWAGYDALWYTCFVICLLSMLGFYAVLKKWEPAYKEKGL